MIFGRWSRKKSKKAAAGAKPKEVLSAEKGVFEQSVLELMDRQRGRTEPAIGLSMLDIMACGLGGVAFLAVLQMLIRIPLPPPLSQNYILAEIRAEGLGQIGFLVQPPATDRWISIIPDDGNQRPEQGDTLVGGKGAYASSITYAQTFTNQACSANKAPCRSVAYLHIEDPALDEWKIMPYFYQYRDVMVEDVRDDFHASALTNLSCSYWSRDRTIELDAKKGPCASGSQLDYPGDSAFYQEIIVTGP